jgi:hypothetical protein
MRSLYCHSAPHPNSGTTKSYASSLTLIFQMETKEFLVQGNEEPFHGVAKFPVDIELHAQSGIQSHN